jgi:hypothetical protein
VPDLKITQLTALSDPTNDDIFVIVNDPTGSPVSRKITLGNIRKDIVNNIPKTANYTATTGDGVLFGDATSGNFNFYLPTATSTVRGLELLFIKVDSSSNVITIVPDGTQTLNGASSYVLEKAYENIAVICDGANWKSKSIFHNQSFEKVNKNLKAANATLNYDVNDNLTSIVYSLPGSRSITKTFNYTGDNLTSIVLSGDTPNNIKLTKTLSYTGDNLTGVAYS